MVDDDRIEEGLTYPVGVELQPQLEGRNRLTVAFRFFLALPHTILVGGPIAVFATFGWHFEHWDPMRKRAAARPILLNDWPYLVDTRRHSPPFAMRRCPH